MMVPRQTYHEELNKLNQEVVAMGDLAQEMVAKGVRAFLEGDVALRKEVAAMDRKIYQQEQGIERHCFEIISLHQPVASDLRVVSSALKVVTDLNRIGRYGRNIADMGEGTADHTVSRHFPLPLMAERALSMVQGSVESFVKLDQAAARALLDRDDEIDELWESMFRGSLTCMIEHPQSISDGAYTILAARYLERIADHACNICERVIFMVSGVRVDHYAKKKPPRLDVVTASSDDTSTDGHYVARLDEK